MICLSRLVKNFVKLAHTNTLASTADKGEREGYGGPRDVTSLSLTGGLDYHAIEAKNT